MRNLLLLCIAVFSYGFGQAQDCTGADHTVLAGNYYYIPSTLTVTAGETIAFQNEGGFHNVNGTTSTLGDAWSNPETFSLGANSGAPGGVCMGTITLNTPGTYQYDCSIGSHAANGMVGTIVVEAASSANSPVDNAADPTQAEADVASVYSGAYTDIATNYNPWWWQSGSVNENFDPGTGNAVLHYSNFNYQGTDLTASNLSGMTHLHVDVWVPADNARMLKVTPINSGTGTGEWLVEVPMTPGSWNSVDIPKASFDGMTWDNVIQMKFDGQFNADGSGNGDPWDVYLDNIYFWNDGSGTTTELDYVNVTFNVNMANETVSPDGVYLAGGADFGFPGDNPMSDDDGDGIWTITKEVIAPYTGNYTFLNGNCGDWSCKEDISGQDCADGPYNDRLLSNITADHTVNTCFGECTTDGTCPPPPSVFHAVTFSVNTDNITVGPNGMYVGGGFLGGSDAYAMTDNGGNNWSVTVDVAEGTSGYWVFFNSPSHGGDWGTKEDLAGLPCGDPANYNDRFLPAVTAPVTEEYCFGQCEAACAAPPATYAVTFQVDMSDYTGGYGVVNLNGSFAGWCGSCIAMDDSDGDGVYAVTVDLAADTVEYKFTLDGWTAQEEFAGGESCTSTIDGFTNRSYIVTEDATLPVVCYNSCDACSGDNGGGTTTTYDVTFNVNTENITVGPNGMYLGGGVFGDAQAHAMSDDDGDGTYTVTVNVPEGTAGNYIFLNSPNDGGDWGAKENLGGLPCSDPNNYDDRILEAVTANTTISTCFGQCSTDGTCEAPPTTYAVTFQVDMSDYTGGYGTVNLNGSFAGWCGGCIAMDDSDGDNVYTVTVDLAADTVEYKFTLDGWTAQEEFAGGESCTSTIDGFTNRSYIVTEDATLPVVCYNSCDACDGTGGGGGGGTDLVATLDVSCSGMTDITEVRIFGPFWNWDPAGGPVATLNADGNYEVVFSPAPEADMEYKWLINGEQEDLLDFGPDLNGDGYDDFLNADCVPITDYFSYANRLWTVGSGDIADTWSQCAPCPAADSVLVTITVDMSEEEVNPIGVFVAGNFQGWSPGSTIATDNGDGTWSYSFNAMPGDNVQYKWLNGTAWGFEESVPADCQYPGDTNRGFDVPSEDYSHPVHCYGSCNPCGAATYAATFTVLTDNITVAADGMHIAGAFEGWSGTAMSDNGDGSWSITLDLEAGSYEFKFQNGLGGWEELDCGGNRSIAIDGSGAASYTGCFAQCGESTSCATDPDPANITFRVDMSEVTDLVADSVYMIGGFTDPVWQAGAILMDDADGDLVYEATALVSGPASIAYKFFNGNPYPNGQGTEVGGETADFAAGGCGVDNGVGGFNRTHDRSGADEVLDIVCFNSCAACGDAPLEGTEVTFSVDMNNYGAAFGFVNVSGTWNEFCGDCNPMTDDDMDGIWTATVTLPEGENYRYKFQVDNWADQEDLAPGDNPIGPCVVKEGGFTNRDLDVAGSEAIVLDTVCWNSCQACIGADDVAGCNDETASNYDAAATANDGTCIYDVTLSVNMNEYALADGDTVYVNSEFNGWCGACNPMSDDDMDGVWTVTIPLTSDYYEYKFTVNGWAADENLAGIGGCVTENFGFTNRVLQVFSNQSEPVVCWNSCSNCEGGGDISGCTDPNAVNYAAIATVDDGSCQYNVTFQVDMSTTALNGGDIVYVNGGFNGWCGACNPMSDDDMDGVWTVTLPLPGGEHEYKFTINGWDMQEELTIGDVCDWNPNDTFANRGFNLTGDLVLDVVCYNSCYSCDVSTGCTDAGAQNYDADADVDDGSCAYMVTLRLDMSQQMVSADGVHVAGSFQGWDPAGTSMTTPGLDLYEYTLQLSNGAHQFIYINGNTWDGQETVPAECGADNGLGGYNREIIVDGADMVLPVVCLNSCTACSGCTDPLSMEFSPFAGEDDGSCATPLVFGCTYQDADNYNPAANMEDGSCEFTGGSSCPTDIDGDGSTAVGDLLIILGSFGQPCE